MTDRVKTMNGRGWPIIRAMASALGLSLVVGGPAGAADWRPERSAELVTTAAAGGNLDITARAIQKIWRERRPALVLQVMNKPGGAGAIASNYLSQRAGDPHYLLTLSMTMSTSQIMGLANHLPSDFTAICLLFGQHVYISVREDSPIRSGRDLIARLRENPGALSIAVATTLGNSIHMGIAIPMKAAGVNVRGMRIVAFKSSADSMTNLLGGHVDVVASTFGTVLPHLGSGRVRVIAFSGPERLSGRLAGVPTWREQGADATFSNWLGIAGPRGIAPEAVAYWESAFADLVASDEWLADLARNFRVPHYLRSQDTKRYWDAQHAETRGILTELGLAKRID